MTIKIYVEGGGDGNALRTKCRQGFSEFFRKAGLAGRMPAISACGSRNDAYDSFLTAVRNASRSRELPLLLVDSEGPVTKDVWNHLSDRDKWTKPPEAADNQTYLMIQCMESWFLADQQCLVEFFGKGFNASVLPNNRNIESINKAAVLKALKDASRQADPKGEYQKGRHSFDILGKLDPEKVRKALPSVDRLIIFLLG